MNSNSFNVYPPNLVDRTDSKPVSPFQSISQVVPGWISSIDIARKWFYNAEIFEKCSLFKKVYFESIFLNALSLLSLSFGMYLS